MNTDVKPLTKKDFSSDQDIRWCPGCGDYAILSQVQKVNPVEYSHPVSMLLTLAIWCRRIWKNN